MIKNILPSKKIISFIMIPVFSFLLFIFLKDADFSLSFKNKEGVENLSRALKEELENRDADADGLVDWEERLYGTNENEKDTDKDGILDGLEVKTGTDPNDPFNKKSRERRAETQISTDSIYDFRTNPDLSNTEKVSRDLLLKISQLKKNNLFQSDASKEFIVNEILDIDEISFESIKKINKDDLGVEEISIDKFKKRIDILYGKHDWESLENEFLSMGSYLEDGDPEAINRLQKNINMNKKYAESLLTIKYPKEVVSDFAEYINIWNEYIYILEKTMESKDDIMALLPLKDTLLSKYKEIDIISRKINLLLNKK